MNKIFSLLFIGTVFFNGTFSLISPVQIYAANDPTCSDIVKQPDPVTNNDRFIGLTIKYNGWVDTKRYWVFIDNNIVKTWAGTNSVFQVSNGQIHIDQVNHSGLIPSKGVDASKFVAKNYDLRVEEVSTGKVACTGTFSVQEASNTQTPGGCTISFNNSSFTPNDELIFKASPFDPQNATLHHFELKKDNINGSIVNSVFYVTETSLANGVSLGKLEKGTYYLEIRNGTTQIGEEKACSANFQVVGLGETGGGIIVGTQQGSQPKIDTPTPPVPPCEKDGYDIQGRCIQVITALGPFPTDPIKLISKIFSIILGLSAGIALLLIIAAGYRLMTSQGNPQAVQAARESLTSAIVGFLFIIFSLVILEIIGVDILHIYGFSNGLLPGAGNVGGIR